MAKARIMIVEDERITASDIEDILRDFGYAVAGVCSSGEEAVQKAKEARPDLVLMDIRIKGKMDGIEAAGEIRRRYDIPVVYLTSHADEDTLARAKLAEPLGYIVKPFQGPELQANIQMALHKHGLDRKAREREDRLDATLSALGEGVICVDPMGLVTYVNPAAEGWTGWSKGAAIGKDISEVFKIIDRQDRRPGENTMMQALRRGDLLELAEGSLLVRKDGTERPVGGHATPMRNHYGRVCGAVLLFGNVRPWTAEDEIWPAEMEEQGVFETGGPVMVVESLEMRDLTKFAHRVARSEVSTIVIQGETGTGKDVLAKFLHYQSRRRGEPFVAVNCAAVPDTLLESELFGFEKGAFTDARAQKKGILELANGGTVLLDEIGEMPLPLQAKLLRVLEDQSFRRLGGIRDVTIDVRIIASTNRNLGDAVRNRIFREDLYYRLNVIQMEVPPLRTRKSDIPPLARHFIGVYNARFKRKVKGLSPEAAERLMGYDWPGNVRELRNVIERAMVLEESEWLTPSSLAIGDPNMESGAPPAAGSEPAASSANPRETMSLKETEKMMLVRALEKSGGNQTQAAKLLGITRDTLRYRMKKFKLK